VNFEEAVKKKTRRNPTDEEVQVIKKDNMRYHFSIPNYHKAINGKWVNKTKKNIKRKSEGDKARLVANGYNKKVSRPPGNHKAREVFPF